MTEVQLDVLRWTEPMVKVDGVFKPCQYHPLRTPSDVRDLPSGTYVLDMELYCAYLFKERGYKLPPTSVVDGVIWGIRLNPPANLKEFNRYSPN